MRQVSALPTLTYTTPRTVPVKPHTASWASNEPTLNLTWEIRDLTAG